MADPFDESVEFFAGAPSSEAIVAWRASPAATARLADLLAAERDGTASAADRSELDRCLELEHLARPIKARARLRRTSK